MSKRVLILAGDAVEQLELYYPVFRLKEEKIPVTVAAPMKKTIHTVVHDFEEGWETYTEKPGYRFEVDESFDKIVPEQYDALIIPGGRAPEYIRLNENIPRIVSHFLAASKPVGVICHAVQVLEMVKEQLAGRSMTAYIACKPSVTAVGANYVTDKVHVDGNLVSGYAGSDLPEFMREFLALLHV